MPRKRPDAGIKCDCGEFPKVNRPTKGAGFVVRKYHCEKCGAKFRTTEYRDGRLPTADAIDSSIRKLASTKLAELADLLGPPSTPTGSDLKQYTQPRRSER